METVWKFRLQFWILDVWWNVADTYLRNPSSVPLIARTSSKVYPTSGAYHFIFLNHAWFLVMFKNEQQCWRGGLAAVAFSQKFAKRRVPLWGLAPLVCNCQQWETSGKNENETKYYYQKSIQIFSAAVEGEKLLGEWILFLPFKLAGFCFQFRTEQRQAFMKLWPRWDWCLRCVLILKKCSSCTRIGDTSWSKSSSSFTKISATKFSSVLAWAAYAKLKR